MATSALNLGDQLHPGQPYTFQFSPVGINPFVTGSDITIDLQALDYLDRVTAQGSAGGVNVFVQFVYGGDGSDTVDGIAFDIANTVGNNHFSYNLNFVTASPGTMTQAQGIEKSLGAGVPAIVPEILPDTSTLVIIVVGIALLAFIMSGGPGIIRGVTEGARS